MPQARSSALSPRLAGLLVLLALAGCETTDRPLFSLLTGAPATPAPVPAAAAPAAAPAPAEIKPDADGRRPLVVLRAVPANLEDDPGFAAAIAAARTQRPEAGYEVVALAPRPETWTGAGPAIAQADRQAAEVMRALAALGVPPARVTLVARIEASPDAEARIYLR